MRGRGWRGALLLVTLGIVAVALALPGAGQSKPPQEDGATYTWGGASILTVDVKPWGGGYVRSTPYLIDCPLACIRSFERGTQITLTAFVTPGHKFESWEGACAGQGNPCTLSLSSALVETVAVLSGQYVPPTPTPATAAVSPALSAETTQGTCPECFAVVLTGSGYHAGSPIDIELEYLTPDAGTFGADDIVTTDASGTWSLGFTENCEFDGGPHSGQVAIRVTGTDAQGASATTTATGACPEAS